MQFILHSLECKIKLLVKLLYAVFYINFITLSRLTIERYSAVTYLVR